ncbi:ferredoxin [Azoarcus sp. DD4]|uniref:(2Fe-2S)-binding protein n=1 Tax=Azoarcus sp. DD4 TaxID=2027405 RepID=UPI0011265F00|nr:(2Fe-2S)-binding protein [Azoarcus sp. DD4]QDF99037.1 ferredoxin [Azoarcus sp. DD4]
MPAPRDIALRVNGSVRTLRVEPDTPLLYVLRNDLELNGPKYGCGLGECGACTVLVDGVAARACVVPVGGIGAREVTTLEGLGDLARPDPVQQAFIDCQGAQCGYCLNGMIMTVRALLDRNPSPSEDDIRRELRGNLCRCGTHLEILASARRAVELEAARRAAGRATATSQTAEALPG